MTHRNQPAAQLQRHPRRPQTLLAVLTLDLAAEVKKEPCDRAKVLTLAETYLRAATASQSRASDRCIARAIRSNTGIFTKRTCA